MKSLRINSEASDCRQSGIGVNTPMPLFSVYRYNSIFSKIVIIKEMPLNDSLEIDLEKLKYEFIKDKPDAVFCTHVSNVTGYILPVDDIFTEAKKYNSYTVLVSNRRLSQVNSADYLRRKHLSHSAVDDADAHYIGGNRRLSRAYFSAAEAGLK